MHRRAEDNLAILKPAVVAPAARRWRPTVGLNYAVGPAVTAHFRRAWTTWAVLAITVLGGWLRFYNLTFPALWNDETLVYWRACGTYGQMLVPLRTDGFPPLHYSLYWAVGSALEGTADVALRNRDRTVLAWAADAGHDGLVAVHDAAVLYPAAAHWLTRGAFPLAVIVALTAIAWAGGRYRAGRLSRGRAAVLLTAVALTFAVVAIGYVLIERSFEPGPLGWRLGGRPWVFPWLVRHTLDLRLTPWVMRAIPALAGTATVPAMYALAKQIVDRRAALVATLFTACSAFMLFYSRDGKMYPDAWLAITASVAGLLWWCRTGRATAFLVWVGGGAAAVGLSATCLPVPVIGLVMYLTQRKVTLRRTAAVLLGLGLTYAGVAGYYFGFNQWIDREQSAGWNTTGLGWVGGFYNGERDGPELARYGATAFLAGYEWTREEYLRNTDPPLVDGPEAACTILAAILALTLVPWNLFRAGRPAAVQPWGGWKRWVLPPAHRAAAEPGPEPAWRVYLWLGVWILPTGYAFYCTAVYAFLSPRRWLTDAPDVIADTVGIVPGWLWGLTLGAGATYLLVMLIGGRFGHGWRVAGRVAEVTVVSGLIAWLVLGQTVATTQWVAVGVVGAGLLAAAWAGWRPSRLVGIAVVSAALYAATLAVFRFMFNESVDRWITGNPWGSLWLPRYLGFIWPAFGIAVAALLMRLPTRALRAAAVGFLLVVNLGMFALRMTMGTEPPIELLADDVVRSQDPGTERAGPVPPPVRPDPTFRAYNFIEGGDIAVAGSTISPNPKMASGRYYLQMASDRTAMSPDLFARSYSDYVPRIMEAPQQVAADVRQSPQLRTVVIWDWLDPSQSPNRADPYRQLLPGWVEVRQDWWAIRHGWYWEERWKWVRREFRRAGASRTVGVASQSPG